ncbi:hypothetical protein K3495_g12233 [Podosphaera aphanis]|nr:hypothetical protein K3495_g12233 [Podosphaera aphanis]
MVINKDYLESVSRAQMNADMSAVLSKTGSTLHVEIQPGGKGTITVQHKGAVMADALDVQRMLTLGSFINNERKAVLKESVAGKAMKFIAVLMKADEVAKTDQSAKIERVDPTFTDAYRAVRAQLDTLNANLALVSEVPASTGANFTARAHLCESGRRIYFAAAKFLAHRLKMKSASEENRKFNEFLLEERVPIWVFNRLTGQKLQIGAKDFEYRRLYFPKDPTKGFYLTFQDIISEPLRDNQGPILRSMRPFGGMLTEAFVKGFCGIPASWDIKDFTNESEAKVLRNVPILIPPTADMYTVDEIFLTIGKSGDKGLPWNSGGSSTPQDLLKFLGTV